MLRRWASLCHLWRGFLLFFFQIIPSWAEHPLCCQQLFSKMPCCWSLFILFSVPRLQRLPGGGGGGTSTQSARRGWNPALLPSSHSLPECHAAELPVLLHRSVPRCRHPLAAAVHCGRQQDLQRLLERPSASSEKLQHLLPGCQQCQRGGCFRLSPLQ